MRIGVIGLGKLGLPMAAVYADAGHQVVAMDRDESLVLSLRRGEYPDRETGLKDLLLKVGSEIEFTTQYGNVRKQDMIFLIVPTPSDSMGRFSNTYIEGALIKLVGYTGQTVIVSTIMPGSTRLLAQRYGLCLWYNPEFVALGSVIRNMRHPDSILIGAPDAEIKDDCVLADFHRSIVPLGTPIHVMSYENAELSKLLLNCYVTMKIAFSNQVAGICERIPGGDVDIVTRFLGSDTRIGSKYLQSGLGSGGPCLPRDPKALTSVFPDPLAAATLNINSSQVHHVASIVRAITPPHATVSVLGLTYKPDTPVVEASQAIKLAQDLAADHAVRVYDPMGLDEAKKVLKYGFTCCSTARECLEGSETAVIATAWKEFERLDLSPMKRRAVVDVWRMMKNKHDCEVYRAVGVADWSGCREGRGSGGQGGHK